MSWRILIVMVGVLWVGQAFAQTPPPAKTHWLAPWKCLNACPSLGCCPDDYCRKPCPTLFPVLRCGGPDDYCGKMLPCLTPVSRCGTCDDYCRKPLPSLLCPPFSPYLKCSPTCR